MGAQMVKEVASKTSDNAGDGTTTATVLATSHDPRRHEGRSAGMEPDDLKRGMDKAVIAATEELKKSARLQQQQGIAQVGSISVTPITTSAS